MGHDIVWRAPSLVAAAITGHLSGKDVSKLSTYEPADERAVPSLVVGIHSKRVVHTRPQSALQLF